MHMDVIPCTVEFSDIEKEKENGFSREISHLNSDRNAG